MNLIALVASFAGVSCLILTMKLGNKIENRWFRYLSAIIGVFISIIITGNIPMLFGDTNLQTSATAGKYLVVLIIIGTVLKSLKGKKLLQILFGTITVIVIAFFTLKVTSEAVLEAEGEPKQYGITKQFQDAANELNPQLPLKVDDDVTLNKVTVDPEEPRLTYHFTFNNHSANEIDLSVMENTVRPHVLGKACRDENMKKIMKEGGIYAYSYTGNDNVSIIAFESNYTDCE